jgi:hypothetical protein
MLTDSDVAKKLLAIQHSAITRNIDFNLSFKRMKQLMNAKRCFYSGEVLNNIVGNPNQFTIDRIDASKGYTDNNVVQCSLRFNQIKSNLTINEIGMMVKKLKTKGIKF